MGMIRESSRFCTREKHVNREVCEPMQQGVLICTFQALISKGAFVYEKPRKRVVVGLPLDLASGVWFQFPALGGSRGEQLWIIGLDWIGNWI